MDVNIVRFDGKPLEKLVEVVSNGIGTLYQPRAIRKKAEADAYAFKVMEAAKAEAEAHGDLVRASTLKTINERLVAKEIQRQNNIDDVVDLAAQQLNTIEEVSDEKVNKDWTTRFFDTVQDISDREMKLLWSKILAGEIQKPKSYSLRTLDLLKNMSTEEANLFIKVCNYAFVDLNVNTYVCKFDEILSKYEFKYVDFLQLVDAGLLQADTSLSVSYSTGNSDSDTLIQYNNILISK